jgi:signal transduction histidine kinase
MATGRILVGMRRWLCKHETLVDSCLAAALIVASLIAVRLVDVPAGTRPPSAWSDVFLVAVLAPIAVRRRYPIGAYVVTAMAALSLWTMNSVDGGSATAGIFVSYGLGYFAERARGFRVFVISATVLCNAAIVLAILGETDGRWFQCASRIGIVLGPYFLGDSRRTRNELVESLRERAHRAEEDQAREARQAVADERARIAHELHDVVAHSLSIMVVQASAGQRLICRDPKRAEESLVSIGETGRSALAEMRRILGVFDARPLDEAGKQQLAPQPDLSDIDALLRGCQSAGMHIVDKRQPLGLNGLPHELSAGIELAVFRVIQEALTNVLKHAGAATVTLRLETNPNVGHTLHSTGTGYFSSQMVRGCDASVNMAATELPVGVSYLFLEIADDGLGLAAAKPADALGRGMIGMRARIDSVGGHFHAGPKPGGGWIVRATIPLPSIGIKADGTSQVGLASEAAIGWIGSELGTNPEQSALGFEETLEEVQTPKLVRVRTSNSAVILADFP